MYLPYQVILPLLRSFASSNEAISVSSCGGGWISLDHHQALPLNMCATFFRPFSRRLSPPLRCLRFIMALFTYLTANDAVDSFYATNFARRALFRVELKSHGPHTHIDFLFIGYNLTNLNYWLATEYRTGLTPSADIVIRLCEIMKRMIALPPRKLRIKWEWIKDTRFT